MKEQQVDNKVQKGNKRKEIYEKESSWKTIKSLDSVCQFLETIQIPSLYLHPFNMEKKKKE